MWRRWTTEWTLSCGERQLALGLATDARDPDSVFETIGHEDTPASRAGALRDALARMHARHPGTAGCRRVRVLLDDRWSVWMSLQGAFWALSPAQREALVRGHLAQQMGTDPSAWRVSSHVTSDGEGLSAAAMQAFTDWTNLSECAFLLPPTAAGAAAGADYRVRIFCPGRELPFAGHPTLGACHAWLSAGGAPHAGDLLVQECGIGLVRIRRHPAGRLAFAAPPLIGASR